MSSARGLGSYDREQNYYRQNGVQRLTGPQMRRIRKKTGHRVVQARHGRYAGPGVAMTAVAVDEVAEFIQPQERVWEAKDVIRGDFQPKNRNPFPEQKPFARLGQRIGSGAGKLMRRGNQRKG